VPAGLGLSFQRFLLPAGGMVSKAPSSLGALPVGMDRAGDFLLPLADDEGFWIGVEPAAKTSATTLALAARLTDGSARDALSGATWTGDTAGTTVTVDDILVIGGIPCSDGRLLAFARAPASPGEPACHSLLFTFAPSESRQPDRMGESRSRLLLRLVDYEAFCAASGCNAPSPLDPEAGYKGYRLP
jgi:hypothetical protein